jgi:hypothetical protein
MADSQGYRLDSLGCPTCTFQSTFEMKKRYKAMHYTKPTVVTAEKAILVIQQVNQTGSTGKLPGQFLDFDRYCCTPSAYEADE